MVGVEEARITTFERILGQSLPDKSEVLDYLSPTTHPNGHIDRIPLILKLLEAGYVNQALADWAGETTSARQNSEDQERERVFGSLKLWIGNTSDLTSLYGLSPGEYHPNKLIPVIEEYQPDQDSESLSTRASLLAEFRILAELKTRLYQARIDFQSLGNVWKFDRLTHKMRFWLNPYDDQNLYNYGYFTLEEIEQWLDNSGPIVKSN